MSGRACPFERWVEKKNISVGFSTVSDSVFDQLHLFESLKVATYLAFGFTEFGSDVLMRPPNLAGSFIGSGAIMSSGPSHQSGVDQLLTITQIAASCHNFCWVETTGVVPRIKRGANREWPRYVHGHSPTFVRLADSLVCATGA